MAIANAICPKCNKEVAVNAADEASVCSFCGAAFITEKAMDVFFSIPPKKEVADDNEELPNAYTVHLIRKRNPSIGNSVTFIHLGFGRPRPLADDAYCKLIESKKRFELPVYITDNENKVFEGVLTGVADGNDIRIVWDVDLTQKTLGVIVETTNSTVTFVERPGATDNW